MRILVIGGTQFVGRHFVEAALAAGHQVTVFHRGQTGADLFPQAERLLGDRDGDLAGLAASAADGGWDATVDVCGYFPDQVARLADALGAQAGRFLLVSSVSAYVDPPAAGIGEDAPLATLADEGVRQVTAQTYGGLKAACERVAVQRFGGSTLLVRPTYVVGPWDPTGRFTYWVRRIARGGDVLVPGPADQAVQVIDARDLAAWMLGLIERGESGAFHAAAPAPPFGLADLLAAIAGAVAPAATRLVWADPDWLARQSVAGSATAGVVADEDRDWWPLWNGGTQEWAGAVDPAAALATGLTPRSLAETARDTLVHAPTPEVQGVAPTMDRERVLLAGWRDRV